MNPWERTWLVVFRPAAFHWAMRAFVRADRRFHVFLLTAAGPDRWLYADWALQGVCLRYLTQSAYSRLMAGIGSGGVLRHHVRGRPRPSLARLAPLTCVGFVRQVLALPPSLRFWRGPLSLWSELRDAGAETLLALEEDGSCRSSAAAAATGR